MATRGKPPSQPGALSEDDKLAIYGGLGVTNMARLFEMDKRDLQAKIMTHGIQPCGYSPRNDPLYKLKDVMPVVVKPAYDIEKYIQTMHISELPKVLSKEYWAAMRSRQMYDKEAGKLWPTEKVVSEVGELMKLVKMNLQLLADSVERQMELSEGQRKIIKSAVDGTLLDLYGMIQEKFKEQPTEGTATHDQDEEL